MIDLTGRATAIHDYHNWGLRIDINTTDLKPAELAEIALRKGKIAIRVGSYEYPDCIMTMYEHTY